METPVLTLTDVRKRYDSTAGPIEVLAGVSLQVAAGETVALTGESGSGKSTLLHLAAGLEPADGGQIAVAGAALSGLGEAGRARLRRQKIGIVFQQFNLIPSLTVAGNIGFQARLAGREDAAWSAALAERLGLAGHLAAYPEALSGGQQQRVAIARALAGRPALVLADEPTGNLDEGSAGEVLALMRDLVAETGAAFLTVTHSDRVAAAMARRVHLSRGRLA